MSLKEELMGRLNRLLNKGFDELQQRHGVRISIKACLDEVEGIGYQVSYLGPEIDGLMEFLNEVSRDVDRTIDVWFCLFLEEILICRFTLVKRGRVQNKKMSYETAIADYIALRRGGQSDADAFATVAFMLYGGQPKLSEIN